MEKLLLCLVALLSACGYYTNARQRLVDSGGISSSGNKPRDEDPEQSGGSGKDDGSPTPDASSDESGDDGVPGAVMPQDCGEDDTLDLKGMTFDAQGAANAPSADCKGENSVGRIECAAAFAFTTDREVEIAYADVSTADGGGRTARHAWNGCGGALQVFLELEVGVFEAHSFTLGNDGATLSHVATGRTFELRKPAE